MERGLGERLSSIMSVLLRRDIVAGVITQFESNWIRRPAYLLTASVYDMVFGLAGAVVAGEDEEASVLVEDVSVKVVLDETETLSEFSLVMPFWLLAPEPNFPHAYIPTITATIKRPIIIFLASLLDISDNEIMFA